MEKSEKEPKDLEKQFNELKSKKESELNDLKEKLSKAEEKCDKGTSDSADLQSGKVKVAVEITETASGIKTEKFELKRDFKISGQIGEAGQQDKLTYVALINQIDLGLTKGYKESEVVEAAIKAISPHSTLRNYVLTLLDRSLAKLRKILQQRTLKVNLAQTEEEKTDHAATKRKPKTGSDQSVNEKLLAEIQEIKTDINHLKDQVHEKQQANRYRKPPRMSRPRGGPLIPCGCKQCQSQGNSDCRHCFKCGAYLHVRESCWKTDQSGN